MLFTIGVYVSPLGQLSSGNIRHLATSITSLLKGEGDRRGAGAYADALIGYATMREDAC